RKTRTGNGCRYIMSRPCRWRVRSVPPWWRRLSPASTCKGSVSFGNLKEKTMELLEALKNRRVTRAFTGKQVQPEVINEILKIATNAPSGSNLQPWEIYVVGGDKKDTLCQRISAAFHDGQRVTAPKYSVPLPGKYSDRTSKLFKDLKPY